MVLGDRARQAKGEISMTLPKPYYEEPENGIVIYHGDCRDILPHLPKVDLVLTDPPYGVGVDYGTYEDTQSNLRILIDEIWPILQAASDRILITPGIANIQVWPKSTWVLCWMIQGTNCGSGPWGFATWQPILAYGKDPWLANGKGRKMDSFVNKCASEKNGHPCPKPLKVWNWIMIRSSFEGESVLDPFMGSGTTLVAAKNLGRRAIGIEIEERYCEIAVNRLRQDVLPFGRTDDKQVSGIRAGAGLG